jgi:DNA (cytosine-5)-methyltransferase 1
MPKIKFIDLFAGIGGLRLGLENAFQQAGYETECVLTSEIKPYAIKCLEHNFPKHILCGDVTKIDATSIQNFDFLLAGFPCQPFSASGKRHGFADTRGTLFFEVERILQVKRPYGFILENVEGLVKHDLEKKGDKIGRTLKTILHNLKELGYKVSWNIFNSEEFGVPQIRKRIFIIGTLNEYINVFGFERKRKILSEVLETGQTLTDTRLTKLLLKNFLMQDLYGKSIKDKRGGDNNIHSWDIELKGSISKEQHLLLNKLFKERRKKKWALQHGIEWMDGMPLTLQQIRSFFDRPNLQVLLDDLVAKNYIKFEHPKALVTEITEMGIKKFRRQDTTLPKGYNIVSGKLSFGINKILNPNDVAPTLVATDVSRMTVPDGIGLRKLTLREGLRICGYPEWFELPVSVEDGFDLLGNTVVVPVVAAIAERLVLSFNAYKPVAESFNSMPVCNL